MSISNIEKNVKLSKLLQQSIMSDAKYSSDLLQIVDLNDDGEFNLPLFDPTISVRVQQLLNSIIKSRINKQEIAGGPVVQATSWGLAETLKVRFKDSQGKILLTESEFNKASSRPKDYSRITPEDTDYSTYVKNHQDALAYCESYVPIQSAEMERALTKADGSLMTPEEALEAKIITEDALTMIGYRIPTEDKYSMIPLRVKGWVSRAAGEVVMLPSDITTLTGADFDVDKMYIMFPQYETKVNKESEIYTQIENSLKGKTNTETLNNYKNFIDKFTPKENQKIIAMLDRDSAGIKPIEEVLKKKINSKTFDFEKNKKRSCIPLPWHSQ